MKFLENEIVISASDDGSMMLTNMRLRHTAEKSCTSFLLEHIQSVSYRYHNHILILVVGLLTILTSFFSFSSQHYAQMCGIITGGLLVAYYIYTRRYYLTITSGGEEIKVSLKDHSPESCRDFIDLLEESICIRKKEILTVLQKPLP